MKSWRLNKNQILIQVNIVLLQCMAFALPLYQKVLAPLIVLWSISSIVNIFVLKLKIKKLKASYFLIAFYLILIVGLLWTENMKSGLFDLEVKMSILLFPFLFLFITVKELDLAKIIKSLILGVMVFFVMGVMHGVQWYFRSDTFYYFFYSRLSPLVHPSYMSMYIVSLMMLLLHYLRIDKNIFKQKTVTIFIIILLFLINIMVLSKIGVIVSIFLILTYAVLWMFEKKKIKLGLLVILSMISIIFFSYKKIEFVKYRVDELKSSFSNNSDNSTGVRVNIWRQSLALIKAKPILGYGTGDVKDELVKKYIENDMVSATKKQYNAHNQFFQILISSGVIGLVFFLLSAYYGIRSNQIFFQFILIIFIFMMVESVLENQAGTIFFGLFFSLLSQKSLQRL